MSTPFEPTQSELNDIKLTKMIRELGWFGAELSNLAQEHRKMTEETGKESDYAYQHCMEILGRVKDDYLAYKDHIGSVILEAEILLEEEYGPAEKQTNLEKILSH